MLEVDFIRAKYLVPTLGELLFGYNSKRVDETPPIWGLHSETVARGIQIVRLILAGFLENIL